MPGSAKLVAMGTPSPRVLRGRHRHRARGRLLAAVATGGATALLLPAHFGPALRTIAAWDVGAVIMGILSWSLILHAGPEETRHHAAAHDPGRRAVGGLVILASVVSLFATAVVLRQSRLYSPEARSLFIGACVLAVASAWILTHTAYTLRYAHLYYGEGHDVGGLSFPGEGDPAYLEFAYFAFTIGMCFQVSDVSVSTRRFRRAVLGQSLLSFAYNTAILATAVNLVVGVFN